MCHTHLHDLARTLAEARGVRLHGEIVPGQAVPTIVCYARESGFDLVLVGRDLHSGPWGTLMGTASRVSWEVPYTVMVVR